MSRYISYREYLNKDILKCFKAITLSVLTSLNIASADKSEEIAEDCRENRFSLHQVIRVITTQQAIPKQKCKGQAYQSQMYNSLDSDYRSTLVNDSLFRSGYESIDNQEFSLNPGAKNLDLIQRRNGNQTDGSATEVIPGYIELKK